MSSKIIINADDYGLTDGVTEAINELANIKAISNTTLMLCANGAPARISNRLTGDVRKIAGIHLQLTGGKPLSNCKEVPSLVDSEGFFKDPRKHQVNPNEVLIEWTKQIKTGSEILNKTPTHLDSHHGMHRIPELFEVYVQLAKSLNIPFRGMNDGLQERVIKEKLRGTSAIVRDWTASCTGETGLVSMIRSVREKLHSPKVIEVVSHPGHCDGELIAISTLNKKRECDYLGLRQAKENCVLEAAGFERSSFGEIKDFA